MQTKASSLSEYLLSPPSSPLFTDQKGSQCPAWVDLLRGRIASPPPKFQPHTEARVPTEVRIKSPVILAVCDQSDQRYEVDSTVQDSIQAHASLESTISGLTENPLGSRPRSRRPSPPRKSYSHTYAGRKSFHPSKCLSRSSFKRVRVGSPCTSPTIRSLGDFSFSNVPASNLIDFLIRFVLERGNEPPVGVHFCFVLITDSDSIFALACKMIRGPADLGIISSNLSSRITVSG